MFFPLVIFLSARERRGNFALPDDVPHRFILIYFISVQSFSDFEIAGSTLAQRYLDQFPEWAYWASRFRDFFSGAWPAQRCIGLDQLNVRQLRHQFGPSGDGR